MVKLILPNSAPHGQESQKCLENSATNLVTSCKKLELLSACGRTSSPRGQTSSPRAGARWPSPWHYFRDIFGSPGQEEPSWAKWVSPSILSMKTTTFKPNLYFCHRIPLIGHGVRSLGQLNILVAEERKIQQSLRWKIQILYSSRQNFSPRHQVVLLLSPMRMLLKLRELKMLWTLI